MYVEILWLSPETPLSPRKLLWLVVVVVVGRWSLLWWFSLSLIVGRGRCRRCWSLPWSFVIVVGHWSVVVGRWLLWFSLVVVVLVVVVRCRDRLSLIVDRCRWSVVVDR